MDAVNQPSNEREEFSLLTFCGVIHSHQWKPEQMRAVYYIGKPLPKPPDDIGCEALIERMEYLRSHTLEMTIFFN